MGHLPLMKRHFIEGTESQCTTSVFRLFWTKQRGRLAKTVPLSLNCFFVNRCSLTSTLTVKQFNTCIHKQAFLVSWAWQKKLFFNMYNFVLDVSFGSSKKVVVTKQSKTPSFETPNLQFCPLFWLRSILVAWTFLVFVPAFFIPVVAKPKTSKCEQFLHNCWWPWHLFFYKVFKKNS